MQYSLMVRELEREHIPVCRQFGLGVLPWSPLAAGFLSGKYVKNQPPPPGVRLEKWKERFADFDTERGWRTLEALKAIARERATTPSAVALAWLLAKPEVTSVIFGARSLEQLDDNLKAAEVKLSADDVQKLDGASAFEPGYPYKFIANIQKRW
jgi:aryl-alcohol dehydrogenase-like predicted oxidoreductase